MSTNAKWLGAVVAVSLLLLGFSSGGRDFIRGFMIGVSGQSASRKSAKKQGVADAPAIATGEYVLLHKYVVGDVWTYKVWGREYARSGASLALTGTMTQEIQSATFHGQPCLADVVDMRWTSSSGVPFKDRQSIYFTQSSGDYEVLGIYDRSLNEEIVASQPYLAQTGSWSPPHDFDSAPALTDGRIAHVSQHTERGPQTIGWHHLVFKNCWTVKHYESLVEREFNIRQLFCPSIGQPFSQAITLSDRGTVVLNIQTDLTFYAVTNSDGTKSYG